MTDRDRTEGDALFAAAWNEDMAEPLADWLEERLPEWYWWGYFALQYQSDPPRVVRLDFYPPSGVVGVVAAWVTDHHLAASHGRHIPHETFTVEFPGWLREAFAEVRRARAAADRP